MNNNLSHSFDTITDKRDQSYCFVESLKGTVANFGNSVRSKDFQRKGAKIAKTAKEIKISVMLYNNRTQPAC